MDKKKLLPKNQYGTYAGQHEGIYYDKTGEQITPEQYNYFYTENGDEKSNHILNTQVDQATKSLLSNSMINQNVKSTNKFASYGKNINTYDDGTTRTIINGVTDGEAWSYDEDHPELFDTRSKEVKLKYFNK